MKMTITGQIDGKSVPITIPIEKVIEAFWPYATKPSALSVSTELDADGISANFMLGQEAKDSYPGIWLTSKNSNTGRVGFWFCLELPNETNDMVKGYLYAGDDETETDQPLAVIADDDSPRLIFVNEEAVSIQDSRGEFEGENKYKWFAATEKQFDKPFSYVNFGTRLEEATHGCVKRIQSMIVSKDEATVNRIADMLDSMGFDAVTGYFDPKEDERSGEVDSLTGYYYVCI